MLLFSSMLPSQRLLAGSRTHIVEKTLHLYHNSNCPCTIRTRIWERSHLDLGGNPTGIPPRFWPTGLFIPNKESWGIPAGLPPGTKIYGGQNLARILPGVSPKAKFLESRQDSWQKAIFPPAKCLGRFTAGILARFWSSGISFLWKIHGRNLGKIHVATYFLSNCCILNKDKSFTVFTRLKAVTIQTN